MKKQYRNILILVCILAVALIFELIYYHWFLGYKEPIRQVSLIVYGSDASRWENLKQGAELAAQDLNAEVTLITMSSENDAKEQISLIRREIANGADALLIAACDSMMIGAFLEKYPVRVPYAFVETGTDRQEGASLYAADDTQMAESLLATIEANEKPWIKAAVIADHMERNSVKNRLETIKNSDIQYADEVVIWEKNAQEKDTRSQFFLQRKLTEEAVDVVIALDNSSMGELIDATVNLNKDIKIYGIADSAKSVYYLDSGLIRSLIFQDEFSAGYLALNDILEEKEKHGKGKKKESESVRFERVNHNNLYDMEHQKLLFPHVR